MKGPILNLGILAHADAGKTTVTEQLLLRSGSIRQAGSVDDGTTHTDWLEVERRRGISVRAASISLEYKGVRVNLIDTPGHVDFLGEVERSLTVLDGAVLVLSAVEGVQAQTRLLWRALEKMGIPTLLVVNKVDRTGCDIPGVLEQLRQECTTRLLPAQQVEEAGSDSCQVLPLESFWEDALAWAADYDPELAEAYLEERPVPRERLLQALREGVAQRQVFPVLFASAKGGKGMEALLEGVVTLLPPACGQEDGALSAVVYQVDHDPAMGKAAHLRVFSGALENRDSVPLPQGDGTQKITQIRRFYGQKAVDVGRLGPGEVGAVYGLSAVRAGAAQARLPAGSPPAASASLRSGAGQAPRLGGGAAGALPGGPPAGLGVGARKPGTAPAHHGENPAGGAHRADTTAVRPGGVLLRAHGDLQGDACLRRPGGGGLPGPQALLGCGAPAGGAPAPGQRHPV